jgi:putative ABC transport system permease protein
MFNLTRKGLWAHKVRFMLTGLAVVLGVAFMAGTMILTDTMGKTFDGLFATGNTGIDVVVHRTAGIDGQGIDVRERVDASLVDQIGAVPGVDAAAGSIEGFAQLVDADGKAATSDGFGGTIGISWIGDERLNPFDLSSGRAPTGPTEVVIDEATFDAQGRALGDTVGVLAKDATTDMTIVGTATFGGVKGLPGITVLAADDTTAQAMFAQAGSYDSIVVASDGSTSPAELADAVRASVGSDQVEVLTGAADTAAKQADLRKDMGFFTTFLLAFAYIALFVGMFIIYNTFSIVIAQRMREMAMLRAIGASRRQVLRAVLLESVIIGIVASAAGLLTGVAMSFGLRALLSGVGLRIPSGDLVITANTVVTAFVVGVGVTLISAVAPAVRASRIRPIAALRETAAESTSTSITRTLVGLALSGVGVAMFAAGVVAANDGAMALLGLGGVSVILGVFVLGPVIARPAMHVLGLPTGVSGATGHLARENAKRNPARTAATASALMIGVALVSFITIVASSSKASTAAAVDHSLRADYVVDSGSYGNGGFGPSIEHDLTAVAGVETVSPLRSSPIVIGGATSDLLAVDTTTIGQLMDLKVTDGTLADVHGDGIAIASHRAEELGVGVGDTLPVGFSATGDVALRVDALFDGEVIGLEDSSFIVGLDTFEANVTDQFDRQVFVKLADGVDASTATSALQSSLDRWPNADLQDQASFKDSITSETDMMLNLIYGLLALAVVIALIGITNTLALSVHERTRELGLLRAVGMTRHQLRTAIRWESVLISLFGTGLGLILGVAGAWGIAKALAHEGVASFVLPGQQLVVIVGLAVLAGVVAALGPARRAGRLNVLEAIASQ